MTSNHMSELKFMLTGHGGFYNLGCEAIVRSTVDLLQSKFHASKFTLYSRDFENDMRQIKDNNIQICRFPFRRLTIDWLMNGLLKRIPRFGRFSAKNLGPLYYKAGACLSIGGDNYTLDYGFQGWLLLLDQLIMHSKIPLIIWGASIGPFESNPYAKSRMKEHLKSVDLITARDSVTVEYLKSLGVTKNVVRVFDPAFSLKPKAYLGPESMFMDNADVLGINVSSLIVKWRNDKNLEILLDEIARFAEAAVADGLKVLLVPHVSNKTIGLDADDEAVLTMVKNKISDQSGSVLLLPSGFTAREAKWIISKCRFFIGSRTHSTIAAISSRVPTISIAYSQKAIGINRDIFGHEDYVLETPLVSRNTLMNKLSLLQKNESAIRSLLKDKESEIIRNTQRNVDAIVDLLDQKKT